MPEARIISYDSIYYHTAYGETPDFIEGIANNTVLDATYLPALVADGMQFMGWYSTHTFDDGTEVSVGDLVRDHSSSGPLHLYAKWSTITVSSVLTNLADEIRVLSGTTEPLGLTEMATNVNEANDEVADQTDLIAQVISALQGKSVPGGGESSGYQVATGTFTVETAVTVANKVAHTVTGLPFQPKIVWVMRNAGTSVGVATTNKNKYSYWGSSFTENSIKNVYTGMGSSTSTVSIAQESKNSNFSIIVTDDGFSIGRGAATSTTITYTVAAVEYRYIAIG